MTRFDSLREYPHVKLERLLGAGWHASPYNLSVGEPKIPTPPGIQEAMQSSTFGYPPLDGTPELREAWAHSLYERDGTAIEPNNAIACCGTREGLFSIIQTAALVEDFTGERVLVANPHYQIYSGAAILVGLQPATYSLEALLADPGSANLDSVRALVLCNPDNPTGAVVSSQEVAQLLQLACKHKFLLIVDEAYLDTWFDQKPASALTTAANMGTDALEHLIATQSLSKRSGLAQLRSGIMAGGKKIMTALRKYRRYHGVALAHPVQLASTQAWRDSARSKDIRKGFETRRNAAMHALQKHEVAVQVPPAGMFLWFNVGHEDTAFTTSLFAETQVVVLPGTYLCWPDDNGANPGEGFIRTAFVHDEATITHAYDLLGQHIKEYS